MLSTIKNDPDWEGQIEIKHENIPEYVDVKEIREEFADCQEFKIKIEQCSVDEELEDLSQECIKDDKDLNRDVPENFDCSDTKCLNSSIGILGARDPLGCEYIGKNINRKSKRLKKNKCEYCNFESKYISCLKDHINSIHTGEQIHTCESYNYESTDMSTHTNFIHREKTHKCGYCDYKTPQKSHLKSHINSIHTREKIHKCDYCEYESPHMSALKRHINSIHTREKILKCEYCDYGSSDISALKNHINCIHTRDKLHKCEYCDYRSPDMSNLKRHINSIHTREKILKCEYCDYGSSQMSNLKTHINSKHTREMIHKCDYCHYESPKMSSLKRHMKCKHKEARKEEI